MTPPYAEAGSIGSLRLKNRFITSALHTMLPGPAGEVTEALIAYYRQRARGGAALVLTEYAHVDMVASQANHAQLCAARDALVPGLARLAEAIHEEGALAGMQLSHAGRQRFLSTPPVVAPSAVQWEYARQIGAPMPEPLSTEAIELIEDAFASAAARVQAAGFDLVEIHGGHGYLIGEFLSPITNLRSDAYGGDLPARQRFLLEVVRRVRRAIGPSFPISVRLSSSEYLPGGISLAETVLTAAALEREGVDLIDVSAGNHESGEAQTQPTYFQRGFNRDAAHAVRRAVRVPVSVVGSINHVEVVEDILNAGCADFVRLGRPLLADPAFPRKAISGVAEDIRPCIRCNDCVNRGVRLKRPILCAVNYAAGRELRWSPDELPRAARRRVVAVVGGGPSGLEAARVAAARGHDVVLFERDQLGGLLRAASAPEFKADLRSFLDYLIRQVRACVDIQMIDATAESLETGGFEVVIAATGSEPQLPTDPHGAPTVDLAQALITGVGDAKRVLLLDALQFSVEAAIHLSRQGVEVTVVDGGLGLASDAGIHHRRALGQMLPAGVHVIPGALEGFQGNAVAVRRADGTKVSVEFDLALRSERTPRRAEFGAVGRNIETFAIGDCVSPRRILDGVHEGFRAALHL